VEYICYEGSGNINQIRKRIAQLNEQGADGTEQYVRRWVL